MPCLTNGKGKGFDVEFQFKSIIGINGAQNILESVKPSMDFGGAGFIPIGFSICSPASAVFVRD